MLCGGGKCQQKYLVKCPAVFTAGLLTQTGMMPLLIARRPTALLVHSSGTYTYLLTYVQVPIQSSGFILIRYGCQMITYLLSFQLEITLVNNDFKHLWLQFAHTNLLKGVPFLVLIILIRYFKTLLLGVLCFTLFW